MSPSDLLLPTGSWTRMRVTGGSVSSSMPGGWNSALAIVREARQQDAFWHAQRPTSCPNDGQPLTTGPRGELFCEFDGYQWDGQDHP